jgi:hypothetical protein
MPRRSKKKRGVSTLDANGLYNLLELSVRANAGTSIRAAFLWPSDCSALLAISH